MGSPARIPRIVQFADYILDLQTAELRRNGTKVILQDQPLQILTTLIESKGRLVTREDLIKKLWPSGTFVGFEQSLNRAVGRLREALGDDAEHPRFVETLPRKGYRWVGPQAAPESVEGPGGGKTVSHPLKTILAALICAALAAYLFRPPLPVPKVVGYTQITHDGRQKSFDGQVTATVLTDGPRLFVQESIDGRFAIAQVQANGGDTVPLPTQLQNVALLNISMDRSDLLVGSFLRTEPGLNLWSIPVLGGLPRRLGTTGADATWMPNGDFLVSRDNRLLIVPKSGEAFRALADVPGLPYWLRWSPDKRSLRFTVQGRAGDGLSTWEMSSNGANLHRILLDPEFKSASRGNWTADGRYFVFQASRRGGLDIWAKREKREWFYKSNDKPVQLTFGPLRFHSPQPSADGNRIFVVGELRRAELQRYDQSSNQFLPYLGGISAESVTFSRDGVWATYSSYPDYSLWRSRIDGTDKLRLFSAPPYAAMPRWSPDGTQIAFVMGEPGKPWNIVIIPKDGGSPRVVYKTQSAIDRPTWTPDGNVLAFGELNDPYSTSEVLKLLDLRTQQVTILPESKGLSLPVLSPDGRYLTAISADGHTLKLFDFTVSRWSDLARMSVGFIEWSPDGQFIYVDAGTGDKAGLYRVRLSDRSVHELVGTSGFERAASGWTPWIGVTPEGAPLLMRDRSTQEVYALDFEAP